MDSERDRRVDGDECNLDEKNRVVGVAFAKIAERAGNDNVTAVALAAGYLRRHVVEGDVLSGEEPVAVVALR